MRAPTFITAGLLTALLVQPAPVQTAEKETVRVEDDRIVLPSPFEFSGPILKPKLAGHAPIEALAAFLIAHPDITRLMVEAHLADGDIKYSIDPGRRRARLIREGLIGAGVDPLRVEAISFGEERPIADPRKPESKAVNRRIELRIAERREPGAKDAEAAEMVALSMGPPPEKAALCLAAKPALDARKADPLTRAWVAYWLGPGRPWFARWLRRCQVMRPLVESHAKAARLPAAWPTLMMIESGCNPEARSRLGALGLWQLMPGTARGLGLELSDTQDQRRRLAPSTRAAGKLLAELHGRFGRWDLALTAYNAGPGAVANALKTAGSQTMESIRTGGPLSPEALNFLPKIRAARFLMERWDKLDGCR